MRPSYLFLAAALLTPLAARAAEPSQADAPTSGRAVQQEQTAMPQSQVGPSALEAIILQHGGLVPNPYKNPEPRLISDAWSQRT